MTNDINKVPYELIYGNRRYQAAKIIGLTHIEAKIRGGDVKRIPLTDIQQRRNSRTEFNKEELLQLSESIRDKGLLEPIGVAEVGTLSDEEFLVYNTIENIHRSDLSPLELGRIVATLMETEKMDVKDVAVRLNLAYQKAVNCLNIFKNIPQEYRNVVAWKSGKRKTKSLVSYCNAARVAGMRLAKNEVKDVFDALRNGSLSPDRLEQVRSLVNEAKLSVAEAINKADEIVVIRTNVPVFKDVLEREMKATGIKSKTDFLRGIIKGNIRAPRKFFAM